jgi:hypothetical protein
MPLNQWFQEEMLRNGGRAIKETFKARMIGPGFKALIVFPKIFNFLHPIKI